MRYQLNEELFVIHFDYASLRNREDQFQAADFHLPFLYGEKEIPNKINLEKLTVTEHHKVAWDQDPDSEKQYDGYLLLDSSGQVLANQYPRASYGQVTTTGDYRFHLHHDDNEDHKAIFDSYSTGEKKVYEYHLLSDVIRNMHEGVDNAKKKLAQQDEISEQDKLFYTELKDSLQLVLGMIQKEFAEKYPQWTYEIKKVKLFPDIDYLVKRVIFSKI